MKIEAIKNVNITVLFSSPLNHLLISQKGLLDLFKTGEQEKDKHTLVEAPGLKVLIFPNMKKEFVFEGVRILVSDKSETLPENSDIVDDFQKIITSNMVERDKITAYGFNYYAIISPGEEGFRITDFIGSKIFAIGEEIKSAGVNLVFEKNNIKYTLEIKPISYEQQKFVAHLNVHFGKNLPEFEELKKGIREQFEIFKNIIKKI